MGDLISRDAVLKILNNSRSIRAKHDGVRGIWINLMDAIGEIERVPAAEPVRHGHWISVNDRLPDNEVDVLVCVTRKHYSDPSKYIRFVAKAFHTDGKTNTEHSRYVWSTWDIDMNYDEEADAYIIPEGWWESVEYEDEFNAVDDFVTHWMPLPEPPKHDVGGDGV